MAFKLDMGRIDQRLKLIGISRAAASRAASPTGSADLIRDMDRGKSGQVRYETARALAEVLECDLAYLTGEQDAPRTRDSAAQAAAQAGPAAMISLSDDELELIALVRRKPGAMGQVLEITRTLTRDTEATVDERGRRRGGGH